MTEYMVKQFVESWQAPYVARSEAHAFSGGLVSSKSLANADSAKIGPVGAISFGSRRVAYPTESLARWIAEKCTLKE